MKKKWNISFLIIALILTLLSYWNYRNRVYDWDMPGYIGCLYTLQFPDHPDKVRILTYGDIKKEAPQAEYKDILGILKPADKARQAFASDTRAFSEQLPYFQIKAGYNTAVLFLHSLGFSTPQSVLVLSAFSYFISGLLFFYLMKLSFPENQLMASVFTVGAMLLPPMAYMARISTPDLFIFQFMLLFLIALFRKWNQWALFPVLFIIILIRPDYIPFALSYLALEAGLRFYRNRKISFDLLLQGTLLIVLYLFIIRFYHYPGWKHLFYDTFIYRRPVISAQAPDFSFRDYLDILYLKIIYFKKITLTAIVLLGLTFCCSKDARLRLIALLIFVNIYIKFLFFPHSSGLRFFFGFIMMLLVICVYAAANKYNGFRLRKIA